jgi:hypothetical protein
MVFNAVNFRKFHYYHFIFQNNKLFIIPSKNTPIAFFPYRSRIIGLGPCSALRLTISVGVQSLGQPDPPSLYDDQGQALFPIFSHCLPEHSEGSQLLKLRYFLKDGS